MRITRLHLRNYRVYEDDLELEIPPGLVGIYGPNGAGKSYLIEAITWAIWGRTRTTVGDVRTDGVLIAWLCPGVNPALRALLGVAAS